MRQPPPKLTATPVMDYDDNSTKGWSYGCAYTLARNKWARDAWFMFFFFNGMCFLVPFYYFTYIYLQLNSYDCTTTETHSNPGYGLRRQYHQGLELWLCSTK
jgi:hypothetical protein